MKFNSIIRFAAVFASVAAVLCGCSEEKDPVAAAVQTKETFLTFEAKDAEPQVIDVYADGTWVSDVSEDWLEVSPETGDKNTKVTVTILKDNTDASGKLNAPREAILRFKGSSDERMGKVYVTQKGDNYFGIDEYTLTEAVALDADSKFKLPEATVMAVSKTGFVITDGKTTVYAQGRHEVKPGDKVTVNGTVTMFGSLVGINADEVSVVSASEVTYPEATAVDKEISKLNTVKYIRLSATLVGTDLRLSDGTNCKLLDPAIEMNLNELNVHKLELLGYYVGQLNKEASFIVCSFTDNGSDSSMGQALPFKDDFSWLRPYIDAANSKLAEANKISDCVGQVTSSADGCANLYTTLAGNGCDVIGELRRRGYTDLNPSYQSIYLQDAYFKFGKNKCQSGLTLPLFKIEGSQDLRVSFRWCSQLQGSGDIDDTKMLIEISGKGEIENAENKEGTISKSVAHKQKNGEMFWQDAVFNIKGATNTTAITIRPEQFGTPDKQLSGYYRFYLDDISVMLAADAVESTIAVDGVDNDLITFEGTPDGPVTFDVSSTADFTVSPSANWLHIENGTGLAGEKKTVTLKCDPSELSTLRKGSVLIRSGITTKTISVVQSAAGQNIEPFISIVGGNSTTVLGQGAEFSATVQANTSFETKIEADWITAVPTTTAKVEWSTLKFKAAPNLTGASRVGTIRFYKGNLESVLTVNQDRFEPSVAVTSTMNSVPASGASVPVHIVANVDFTVDAPGVTLPVSSAKAGTYDLNIPVPANTGAPRKLAVTFKNSEYSYETSFVIWQAGATEVFSDDFSWVAPSVNAWNAANSGKKVGDTIGTNGKDGEAPNVHSDTSIKSIFEGALAEQGYEDMNPSLKVMYLQDQYLKLSKTGGNNTALRLPAIAGLTAATDVFIEFDHATMCQGSGVPDDGKIVVVIEGDGTFDNGTKCSDIMAFYQKDKTYNWTHSGAYIKGMTSSTRLVLVMYRVVMNKNSEGVYEYTGKYNFKVSGAGRLFIDNIKITK